MGLGHNRHSSSDTLSLPSARSGTKGPKYGPLVPAAPEGLRYYAYCDQTPATLLVSQILNKNESGGGGGGLFPWGGRSLKSVKKVRILLLLWCGGLFLYEKCCIMF